MQAFIELVTGLDLPTKKKLEKLTSSWQGISKSLGSYSIWFKNGKTYDGKGPSSQMLNSVKRFETKSNPVVRKAHRPTNNIKLDGESLDDNAFKEEAIRLHFSGRAGGLNSHHSTRTFNSRASPGLSKITRDGF